MKNNLLRLAGIIICFAFILEAVAQLRIPARPVREMLAATHTPLYAIPIQVAQAPAIPTRTFRSAALPTNCVFTITPTSISVPYTGGSGVITVTAHRFDPTALVLEPMTNGCISVMVTNADPLAVWRVQRSTDLVAWVDGQVLNNSTYYQWAECFPTNSNQLFLRLLEP